MPTTETINRFDLNKDRALGIDLPLFDEYGSRFKQNYTTIDQASANARNLLLTNKGERVMLPTFGCDLYRLLFEPITDNLIDKAKSTIKDQFDIWLPYIFINDLTLNADNIDTKNTLYLQMVISLRNNTYETKPFYLEISRNII